MPADQRHADFPACEAVAHVDITKIPAVAALVIGQNAELKHLALEVANQLVHRSRVNRAGRYIDDSMTPRHVKADGDVVAIFPHHDLHPTTIAQPPRRRSNRWHFQGRERWKRGECFPHDVALTRKLLGIRNVDEWAADAMPIVRTLWPRRILRAFLYGGLLRAAAPPKPFSISRNRHPSPGLSIILQ